MEYHCQRCNEYKTGSAYRVTSEEFGLLTLNIIVCYQCSLDARRFGLHTEITTLRVVVDKSHPDVRREQAQAAW